MEYSGVLLLIQDLNQQIQHFEQLKQEHEIRRNELNAKESAFSKLAEEAAGALEAVAGFVKNADLKSHLKSLQEAFSELGKKSSSQPEDEIIQETHHLISQSEDQKVPEEEEQEVLLSVNFPEANHVELALAPWNWSSKPMEKCDDSWKTRARIPSGNGVQFKFIVDGVWRCSENYPVIRDTTFENNFIDCV